MGNKRKVNIENEINTILSDLNNDKLNQLKEIYINILYIVFLMIFII